tara:strand:+ start:432 stop:812 length:381 start_codon:yes stop_codon:yes gene_type:complete
MALTGAKYQEASMGQYGSSFLDGDGDSVDLSGSSATRYICSITFITDVVFQEIQTLGGEIGSISTVIAENNHDDATNGFGAAANAIDIIKGGTATTHVFPKGLTIFGRWDYVELHSGMCICYFAPV